MLASALHLFLETWVGQSGIPIEESLRKSEFRKHGWLSGYDTHFTSCLGIGFKNGPADLTILEEVVLARNRIAQDPVLDIGHEKAFPPDLRR